MPQHVYTLRGIDGRDWKRVKARCHSERRTMAKVFRSLLTIYGQVGLEPLEAAARLVEPGSVASSTIVAIVTRSINANIGPISAARGTDAGFFRDHDRAARRGNHRMA